MVASFEIVQKVWIKNQYSVTIDLRLTKAQVTVAISKKKSSGRPGINNFSHSQIVNKQFFEVGL